jgi:Bromodomain
MGHPNSKEAKRLRRTEDFPIATLRQVISQGATSQTVGSSSNGTRVRILAPCNPTAKSDNWQFYLHNIKGLNGKKIALIKSNLEKAIEIAKSPGVLDLDDIVTVSEMEKALAVFAKVGKINEPTPAEQTSCNRAKVSLMRLLDKATGDVYSSDVIKEVVHRDIMSSQPESTAVVLERDKNQDERVRLGLSRNLSINEKVYKEIGHAREEYMADALTLKEEMDYQGDDEDEDDEDEDNAKYSGKPKDVQEAVSKEGEKSSAAFSHDFSKGKQADQLTAEVVATVVENGDDTDKNDIPTRIGKVTPYDDFCADIPTAPELIRRCLAVLRVVTQTNAAEPFIYPVDPQTNPGYYESILRPMCMREVGKNLYDAAKDLTKIKDSDDVTLFIEATVAKFARDMRVIAQNCSCYPSAGATVIAAGDELLRIFERLLLDWVLAPRSVLPSLEDLDDDKCVEFHDSDDDSLVLLCDGCEGKYNMGRLDPPLRDVPKGDWFCPRCLSGRCWESLDPRKDKVIMRPSENGGEEQWTIKGSYFIYPDDVNSKTILKYRLRNNSNAKLSLPVDEIDKLLEAQGTPVEPVHCIEAVSECPGYSQGPNRGLYENLVPVPSNPSISDAASQAFISSTVYQDTIISSSTFMLVNPEDLHAAEWSRLLTLLVMKCASSEMMNSLASKLEADAAEKMLTRRNEASRLDVQTLLPLTNAEEIDEVPQTFTSPVKAENKFQEEKENSDAMVVVVDSTMIEVVNNVSLVGADGESSAPVPVGSNDEVNDGPDAVLSEENVRKQARTASIDEKDKRYKLREESLVAYSIKNQLRSTVASFEEDHVSLVVDNTLGSREKGLNLVSTRCRGLSCDFCGLSDAALGSPLLRVPNMEEWYELMPHMGRNRQVFLVADISRRPSNDFKNSAVPSKSRGKSLLAVKIRVGGELLSDANDAHFEGIVDGGMLEFLPRNEEGYQNELSIRNVADIPFISGSLSAHECCAISAHNARKERVISEYKTNKEVSLERDAGILCGRTLSLGRDRSGRSFWKFNADNALFVCDGDNAKIWRRYEDPEVIASVLFSLGKDPVVAEIKCVFPEAVRLLRGRKWTQLLLKRPFTKSNDSRVVASSANLTKIQGAEDVEDEDEPYQPGEEVLVESKCGRMLWDAKVLVVSQKDDKVNGYRVRYKGWSSRFDEWVTPFRVVEPIEANLIIQKEMIQELHHNEIIVPDVLKTMNARKHVNSKDRARSRATIPELTDVAKVSHSATSGERGLAWAKAALLMIEAALPCGAIDNSSSGAWRPAIAAEWRKVIQTAQGPYTLMGCAFLLEENIDPEWIDPHATHLLSCLPQRWKSIREATVSSLCLRIVMLDQGVLYDTVDTSKYIGKGRGER